MPRIVFQIFKLKKPAIRLAEHILAYNWRTRIFQGIRFSKNHQGNYGASYKAKKARINELNFLQYPKIPYFGGIMGLFPKNDFFLKNINQLTDQPTKGLTDQPTNWPTDWLIDQPADQPTDQELTNWPTNWPTNWRTDGPTDQPTDQLTDQLTNQLTDPPTVRTSNPPIDGQTYWPTDQLTDWRTDGLTDWRPTDSGEFIGPLFAIMNWKNKKMK